MSSLPAKPSESEGSRLPTGVLPPVAPPTATFILQLFLIPLLIVSIVVVLWLLFSWVAHVGRDNAADLATAIERGDKASWQRAYELADLLRSPDPKYDALRHDVALADKLANFLNRDLAEAAKADDRSLVMRRMYLCRAIGSFDVLAGLPVLIKAATDERDPIEVEVRYSALEAIATLAHRCGPAAIQNNAQAMQVVLEASRAQDSGDAPPPTSTNGVPTLYRPHAELRAVAAYALGVIGGDEATERLARMLHDPYPNARYNAATGLARHGDAACASVLCEMLDPANELAVRDEADPNDQARKRTTVLLNGIKASLQLAETNRSADIGAVKKSLSALAESPLENVKIDRGRIQAAAAEALRLINARNTPKRT